MQHGKMPAIFAVCLLYHHCADQQVMQQTVLHIIYHYHYFSHPSY
jgi:hypothetical protein